MSERLEAIADELEDALTDYGTWLADAVRRGVDVTDSLDQLRSLCQEAIDELDYRLRG